jgi:hypothetical protein
MPADCSEPMVGVHTLLFASAGWPLQPDPEPSGAQISMMAALTVGAADST